jgi:hypothetical protein
MVMALNAAGEKTEKGAEDERAAAAAASREVAALKPAAVN